MNTLGEPCSNQIITNNVHSGDYHQKAVISQTEQ